MGDPSKIMTQWFSTMDFHTCVLARNIQEGIVIWLHNYGCLDATVEKIEEMFSHLKRKRIDKIIARKTKRVVDKGGLAHKLPRAPCREKFYSPETTTAGESTTTAGTTTTIMTTTTTTEWQSTTTTEWTSTTCTTPSQRMFFGF